MYCRSRGVENHMSMSYRLIDQFRGRGFAFVLRNPPHAVHWEGLGGWSDGTGIEWQVKIQWVSSFFKSLMTMYLAMVIQPHRNHLI